MENKEKLLRIELKSILDKFLLRFPKDAKSWIYATGEISDFSFKVIESYNCIVLDVLIDDPKAAKTFRYTAETTASEYNIGHISKIEEYWEKLPTSAQLQVFEYFEYFRYK